LLFEDCVDAGFPALGFFDELLVRRVCREDELEELARFVSNKAVNT